MGFVSNLIDSITCEYYMHHGDSP